MKSKEVLELLQITRPTLTKYVKTGVIKTNTLPNGRYDYDKDSVYKIFNKGIDRKTYIYGRVSTHKQKADLETAKNDTEITTYAKHLSLINVISIIASYIDQFLAFHFLGPANLANYAFATSPPEQIKGLFKGLPDLALPKFSERTEEELKKTMTRKIIILTVFTILVVAAYIILAPWFYKIFFPRYVDAIFLSQIFALSLLNTPSALIIGALTAHKKLKKLYLFNVVNPLFQILIMAVLTPLYGLIGLIIARIIARTFTSFFSLGIYYKS